MSPSNGSSESGVQSLEPRVRRLRHADKMSALPATAATSAGKGAGAPSERQRRVRLPPLPAGRPRSQVDDNGTIHPCRRDAGAPGNGSAKRTRGDEHPLAGKQLITGRLRLGHPRLAGLRFTSPRERRSRVSRLVSQVPRLTHCRQPETRDQRPETAVAAIPES